MIGEYRFFQEFFDGQIVKEDTQGYKLFKIMLVSLVSAIGLFLWFSGLCSLAEFLLLELGIFWNVYSNIDKKISLLLCVAVSILYFYFAAGYEIYSNALIYVATYIPLQMMALSKDYSEGSFVQIKKKITDYNKILFVMFFVLLFVTLSLFNFGVNGEFTLFDGLSASLLVCSAVLRNERYFEYYVFRIFALILSLILWVMVAVDAGFVGTLAIIAMYLSYLVFDIVTFLYQSQTYVNQIMLQEEKLSKLANQQIINDKLESYKNTETLKEKKN